MVVDRRLLLYFIQCRKWLKVDEEPVDAALLTVNNGIGEEMERKVF